MGNRRLFISYVTFVCNFVFIFAATHWVVTEDGRLQPQIDSVYQLSKPHDLMAFLAQEDRMIESEELKKELFYRKVDYEVKDEKDVNGLSIEEKLQATDPDCIKAGAKSTSMALQESTMSSFEAYGLNVNDFLPKPGKTKNEPYCANIYQLPFSMHCFEHFMAMNDRESLAMEPELSLRASIPDFLTVSEFANSVAAGLQKNATSWVLYNLAAVYWRIQGNAFEAAECARRSLHFSPRQYKTIALVQLGNILSQTQHQEEAILVLHAAVDHTPTDATAQYTLANSYAILGDLNRSVLCYENVLRLKPDMESARKKKHGIQCLHKLEKALENQHSVLQSTLNELKDQQKKFEDWNALQEKIMAAQASVDQRLRSQLEYQEYQLRNMNTPPAMDDCQQFEKDGYMFYQCNIKTDISTLDNWGSTMLDLKNRLINFQAQTHKIVDMLTYRANHSNATTTAKHDTFESGSELELPTMSPKYPRQNLPATPVSEPDLRRCHSVKIPKIEEIPSIFLPPENEGFDVQMLLSEKIGLSWDVDHPLPWYPPICEKLPTKLMPYDQVASVRNRNLIKLRLPDPDVQRHLLNYIASSGENLEEEGGSNIQHATALAQVGQRILTAVKNKAGPVWLLHVLSGLYWRAHGNAQNGMECFRHALKLVPQQWLHLPLINLAALLLKVGHSQDAAELARLALHNFENEPNTNFLLGVVDLLNGNYSTAATHLKQVLAVDPGFTQAEEYLLTATCLSAQSATLQCKKDAGSTVYRTVLRCSSEQNEEEENEEHCEVAVPQSYLQDRATQPLLPPRHSGLEVAAIADTEDNWNPQTDTNSVKNFFEEPLPEGLLRVGKVPSPTPVTLDECQNQKPRSRSPFTSTWLSVAAKNIDFRSLLAMPVPPGDEEPYCDENLPVSMATMDHLAGVRHRNGLAYKAESGLKDALHGLVFDNKEKADVPEAGRYLAHALKKNSTSWVLTTAASLYWRVNDNAYQAINCLRNALHYAPYNHKDIPLISLANILHRSGLHNDALVAAHMALDISPTFVVIHFTIANIHSARGDVARALAFYQSTLALQPSFEPAREKMVELQCKQLIFDDN